MLVHGGGVTVVLPHNFARLNAAFAEEEDQPHTFVGLEREPLLQRAAVVAAELRAAGASAALHRERVALRTIRADERVPQAVVTIRLEVRGEELIPVLFIIQVVLNHAVLISRARRIEAHLEVAVIHIDLVEGKLAVRICRKIPHAVAVVADNYVPDLHRVILGDKQRLLHVDAAVVTQVLTIGKPVAANVLRLVEGFPDRLPADAPEIAVCLVPQIHIVPREIHRHAVGTKARDAMVFAGAGEQIAARRLVDDAAQILCSDIVCPGNGCVHPVDHIFACSLSKYP